MFLERKLVTSQVQIYTKSSDIQRELLRCIYTYIGFDVCGRIVKLEDQKNLKKLQIGDLVYGQSILSGDMMYGQPGGSFAEYCVVNIYDIQKAPKNMNPLRIAAIPLVSQTSWKALVTAKLSKGQKLLILGGSTATGMAAIQIAKNHIECSEVVVTSSQEELMKLLGADRVINYRKEQWEVALKDYECDAIYDCVGGIKSWTDCRSEKVLKTNGHYVTIVGDDENPVTMSNVVNRTFSYINRSLWGAVGYQTYDFVLCDPSSYLDDITKLVESGKLDIMLDQDSPFEFDDFGKMFEKSMARKAKGKLVLHVSDDTVGDDQKYEVTQEAAMYQINKRPKHDLSDDEAEGKEIDFKLSAERLKQKIKESVDKLVANTKAAKENKEIDDDEHLVLFIHGYSNTEQDVKDREERIDKYLGTKQIATATFDWKSYATGLKKLEYKVDQHAATKLGPYFAMFLEQIRENGPFKQIDIIAHSMGNYLLCKAIEHAQQKETTELFDGCNILCAAADVEIKHYKKIVSAMEKTVSTWTHFYCTRDKALMASDVANLCLERAGQTKIDLDFVENIKCDALAAKQDDFVEHSYIDEVFSADSGDMVAHIRKKLKIGSEQNAE